jgi:hypothetical protein
MLMLFFPECNLVLEVRILQDRLSLIVDNSGKQCFVVPTKLKGRFPLLQKSAFCLLVAAPPIPFDRTTNCAAARPADASRAWTFNTVLSFLLDHYTHFHKQTIQIIFHVQSRKST